MADREKITVLFVNPSSGLSGDTLSLGNLIESLCDRITPIVLVTEKYSPAYEYFNSLGVECLAHQYLTLLEPLFWNKLKNVLFHPWRLRFIKWLRFELPCLRYLKKELKGRHIDIIHTNRSQVTIGYRLAKVLDIPHVWHIRQHALYGPYRVYGGLSHLKTIINSADAKIIISNFCKQEWGLDEKNTWTLFDAVQSVNDCCYIQVKQPYILFLSHILCDEKGARRAVEAFGKSGLFKTSDNIPIKLKMVGICYDDYKKDLMALAKKYGCEGAVDLVSEQKDVKPLFANAMAFINPSINEGLGRTTAEAMFFGCPVIAHASGGTLDLIKDRETGHLFNTVEECAEMMKIVCTTNQEKIILQAQEFASQNLCIENYGEKIMEVYEKVLNNKIIAKIKHYV